MGDSVKGGVLGVMRLEAACVLALSVAAYSEWGAGWGVFALCFLVPDLALLGYLAGPRLGAALYNSAHSYVGALLCLAAGVLASAPGILAAGLIWTAHIGFDRMLGYGLKYQRGFRFTHLGLIGRDLHQSQPAQQQGQ